MKQIFLLFGMVMLIAACTKQDLHGSPNATLVGEWMWLKSELRITVDSTFLAAPTSDEHKLELQFLSKGKLHYLQDGDCIRKHRIKSIDAQGFPDESTEFYLELSRKNDIDELYCIVDASGAFDTLLAKNQHPFFGFPFPESDNATHYFVRSD